MTTNDDGGDADIFGDYLTERASRKFKLAILDASVESQARVLVRMIEREHECPGALEFAMRVCDALATEEEAANELIEAAEMAPPHLRSSLAYKDAWQIADRAGDIARALKDAEDEAAAEEASVPTPRERGRKRKQRR